MILITTLFFVLLSMACVILIIKCLNSAYEYYIIKDSDYWTYLLFGILSLALLMICIFAIYSAFNVDFNGVEQQYYHHHHYHCY